MMSADLLNLPAFPPQSKTSWNLSGKYPCPEPSMWNKGHWQPWALEVSLRFNDTLVITDTRKNHWIGSSGENNDPLDTFKLTEVDPVVWTGITQS
jgi:hypothetical protein